MRVLHVAAISRRSLGIENQMAWEQIAANELGITWTSTIRLPDSSKIQMSESRFPLHTLDRFMRWFRQRRQTYSDLLLETRGYDLLVLRYSVHDPFLLTFIRKSRVPVVLAHHTLERKELRLDGPVLGRLRAFAELLIGSAVNRMAAGQLAVTNEILQSVPTSGRRNAFTHVYPNGIISQAQLTETARDDVPNLLFVSSTFQPWHGLDILLEALRMNQEKFKIHLVGTLSDEELSQTSLDKRIVVHGRLETAEIMEIASKCSVGIASLALSRAGLTEGSTLKVREYLSMGLPVVADHNDVFPEGWPYFRKLDVSPQRLIGEMLQFAAEIRSSSKSSVRNFAEPYIDKRFLLGDLYQTMIVWPGFQK